MKMWYYSNFEEHVQGLTAKAVRWTNIFGHGIDSVANNQDSRHLPAMMQRTLHRRFGSSLWLD